MKALLKILYIMLALLILILLAGIFLPRNGHIESDITINAPTEIVFDQVNTLKNWENWSPWYAVDTTMKFAYEGSNSGSGASYSWTSEHSGTGKLSIITSEKDKLVEALIDYGRGGKANTAFRMKNLGEKETELKWTFDTKDLDYFERYFVLLFKKNMLTNLNAGTKKIKQRCEILRLDRISDVQVIDLPAQPSIGMIDSSSLDKMEAKMTGLYQNLTTYLTRRNLEPTGPRFTIYYSWNPKGISKFACCLPVAEKTWGWKEYSYIELPQGRAATLTHFGKFGTATPYLALDRYLKNNNLKMGNYMWEVYQKDITSEPDTSKWELQIYYPLQ
jgi:effector-binding domain-containing protein